MVCRKRAIEYPGEYGCYIMPKRIFQITKSNNYYYQYKQQTWREKIKKDVLAAKGITEGMEEFLEELAIMGYEVRRGKYASIKAVGMQKFVRLTSLGEECSDIALREYFKDKTIDSNFGLRNIKVKRNNFNNSLLESSSESKVAIEKSQMQAEGRDYTEYQKTRYMEIQRYYQFKKQLEYLEENHIKSFEDIETKIVIMRGEIKGKNMELKKYKENFEAALELNDKAQDFIRLYKDYEYAMYYKKQDEKYLLPKEVEIFLKLKEELYIENVEQAKGLISLSRSRRLEANELKKEILEMQRELNHLDTIKEEQLTKSNLYIHNIKFGGNRIDYSKCDDDYWHINLPYSHESIKIEKKFTAYNEKTKVYTLYLVDDKEYELENEKGNIVRKITGKRLDEYVAENKKENDRRYSEY